MDLKTILCVGEPQEIREAGKHEEFVLNQLKKDLKGLTSEEVSKIVSAIAYEPIWAIGTGLTAEASDAGGPHYR